MEPTKGIRHSEDASGLLVARMSSNDATIHFAYCDGYANKAAMGRVKPSMTSSASSTPSIPRVVGTLRNSAIIRSQIPYTRCMDRLKVDAIAMTTQRALPPTPAPWAEVVPGMGPMTVDDLLIIPDDGSIYEVVEGVLVRMAGSGEEATFIGGTLYVALRSFVQSRRLGVVTPADGIYRFPGAETGLLPDIGFYSRERHPDHRFSPRPIPFVPDLAVEVASPDQKADEMAAKARVYLSGGTLLVWVVWPQSKHIDVWHAKSLDGPVRILGMGNSLDGEDVIAGFTYPVANVFADPFA